MDVSDLYPSLAQAGLEYGPVFRAVRAAWRRGEEVFAEVALPEGTPVAGFGVHPALLDAALHVSSLTVQRESAQGPSLPFAWNDVAVHAAGAAAARVRARPSADGQGLCVLLADGAGGPVASAGSLVLRPLPHADAGRSQVVREALVRVEWLPVSAPRSEGERRWAVLGPDGGLGIPEAVRCADLGALAAAAAGGEPVPDVVVACCVPGAAGALALVQEWLGATALENSRLVVVTRRAVDAGPGVGVELADAPVWGLVRVAARENPGRLVLADVDVVAGSGAAIAAGLDLGEPELAVRGGQVRVPRLVRVAGGLTGPDHDRLARDVAPVVQYFRDGG